MRWLWLYQRSRRVPLALTTATAAIAMMWVLWLTYADSSTVDPRVLSLTVMLAVAALVPTLSGADDALERTASVNWPARRAGHMLVTMAVITALLLLTTITSARFEPFALVLRNTAGLLGLAALGAALLGTAFSWIAPLTWTLIAMMPWVLDMQLAAWLVQPAGTTAATACASTLAASGLLAYTLRGCPRRPAAETAPDR